MGGKSDCLASLKLAVDGAKAKGQRVIPVYPGGTISSDGATINTAVELRAAGAGRLDPPVISGPCVRVAGIEEVATLVIDGVDLESCIEVRAGKAVINNASLRAFERTKPAIALAAGILEANSLRLFARGSVSAITLTRGSQAELSNLYVDGFKVGIYAQESSLNINGSSTVTGAETGIVVKTPPSFSGSTAGKVDLTSLRIDGAAAGTGILVEQGVRGDIIIRKGVISGFAVGIDSRSPLAILDSSTVIDNGIGIRLANEGATNASHTGHAFSYVIDNVTLRNQADLQIATSLPDLSLVNSKWSTGVVVSSRNSQILLCAIEASGLSERGMRPFKEICRSRAGAGSRAAIP